MPACESKTLVMSTPDSATSSRSLATLPTSLNAKTSFLLSPSIARPAQSYPRYSSRERPTENACQRGSFTGDRFNPARTIKQGVENELAVLLDQVVDVAKDTTVSCQELRPSDSELSTYHILKYYPAGVDGQRCSGRDRVIKERYKALLA